MRKLEPLREELQWGCLEKIGLSLLITRDLVLNDSFHQHAGYSFSECIDNFERRPFSARVRSERGRASEDNTKTSDQHMKGNIYFHRTVDLHHTEQFGAFLYELMENIQIARVLERILVIPNVFIAPRDNVAISQDKRLHLKSISLAPLEAFIDLDKLREVVNVMPLAQFYEETRAQPALLFLRPESTKPIGDDATFATPFGKLHVEASIGFCTRGLQSLSVFGSNEASDYWNWIVLDNERLPQPNWHNVPELEYGLIRVAVCYSSRLRARAEEYARHHRITENPTLMIHWRRGDFSLFYNDANHEDETRRYYQAHYAACSPDNLASHVQQILAKDASCKQVFLLHNNADNTELQALRGNLAALGLAVLEYENTRDEPYREQNEGMVQQLIGARCKIQLHGPGCLERMSAFGRWVVEERRRYHPLDDLGVHYVRLE